ncbi:YndJ family transporter [Paenibacillus sp. FSL K6-4396]|uniref:YndJ family transporter n=1 Tax=unclassified Paenibacillus TaxID=185978 RepID=UPI001780F500|nr:YndJ family transporter [Paenibacillus sp. CFBP 13594]MBD8842022.1 YndJ family transporter [Paenibacillus sp. CFBP 13594]
MNSSLKQLMKSPAFPGGIITILIFYLDYFQFELVEKFLLFAAFVIVPLVISLLNHDEKNTHQRVIYAAMKWLQFPAALFTLASVMSNKMWGLESTAIPGTLSLGWLLFTLLLGIYGLATIVSSKGRAAEVAIGAGLVYFFIGGIWFTLYQYQLDLFQANPATHALSSVHFHFSSAIVPIFIGALGRIMTKKSWYPWVVAIDIIGPILIAIGMIFSKPIEYVGVTLFACNIVVYTAYLLAYLRKNTLDIKAAFFLGLSCLAFYTVVVISIFYPLLKNMYSLTILDFIPIYGSLHAFGFVLCGLIGWVFMVDFIKEKANQSAS